ncbi:hypothetical protein [Alcanivorax sp. DP30]|mgnify:FL=1|uniref:hypothetical protein n=1 Tax=Alcanivorax sp. DP30 TaxID=2606217 RepID=UPI001371B6F8|nr:hypothetical protein [Alcanivorax sp. DP30]MZR63848.1 hypothetical protein [Alcanivorax sp. DP30]
MTWLTLLKKGGPYLVVLAVAAALVGIGWVGKGWHEDSKELERQKATADAITAALKSDSKIAAAVEEKLSGLKANQTVIDRGVTREIQKTVYRNVCLPGTGVSLLNAAATNDITGLSAEPDGEMPAATANPE